MKCLGNLGGGIANTEVVLNLFISTGSADTEQSVATCEFCSTKLKKNKMVPKEQASKDPKPNPQD